MLLAIDVGNTETVIGLFSLGPDDEPSGARQARLVGTSRARPDMTHHWRLSTVDDRTPDEHALLLSNLLELSGLHFEDVVSGMAVTSSVPLVTTSLRQMAERWFEVPCVVLEPGLRSGMPILYDNPKEVGPDRIANAVGAYDLYGGPCIVVDLGTATTFDAISVEGEYLGGAIAPGLRDFARRPVPPRRSTAASRAGRASERHRQVDGRVDPVGRPLRFRRPGGRHVQPVRRRARTVHRGGDRRALRRHRPLSESHRSPRAMAHTARPAPGVRAQRPERLKIDHRYSGPGIPPEEFGCPRNAALLIERGPRSHDRPYPHDRPAPDDRQEHSMTDGAPGAGADDPLPFRPHRSAAELHERFDDALGPGEETDTEVAVAGRVMLVRPQGKLAFARLDDSSGSIQLFARDWRDRGPPRVRRTVARGLDRRHGQGAEDAQGRALRRGPELGDARRGAPVVRRQVEGSDRHRDPVPPA